MRIEKKKEPPKSEQKHTSTAQIWCTSSTTPTHFPKRTPKSDPHPNPSCIPPLHHHPPNPTRSNNSQIDLLRTRIQHDLALLIGPNGVGSSLSSSVVLNHDKEKGLALSATSETQQDSSGAVSWASKKQPVVTLSTTEAEYIAATYCVCQGVWLQRILEKLGLMQKECITVFCDNSSAIKLSRNPILHGLSKHIDVGFHFLRDMSRKGLVELIFCSSQEQLSDIITKPLKYEVFSKLRDRLGLCVGKELN